MTSAGSIIGHAVKRREDPALITGRGSYVGDMNPEGLLHAAFVRSEIPHGRVTSIDKTTAEGMPGVVAIYAAGDLRLNPQKPWNVDPVFSRPPLASVARYIGDPIAVVIATSERHAHDAAAAVWPEYQPLDHVVAPEDAVGPGAPLLFPDHGSNVALAEGIGLDTDPLDGAEVIVRQRIVNQRLAPVPMESATVLASAGDDGRVTVWLGTQDPFGARGDLAAILGLPTDRVRVIAPAIGGGFGAKGDLYPEHAVVAAAAIALGKPVRWLERRTENMVNMVHGRNQIQEAAIGATSEGRVVGLSLEVIADVGAYPAVATWLPRYTLAMTSGTYDIPSIQASFRSVATNTTPGGPYRGAGRPEAIQMLERMMDLLADHLGIDRVEIRRRNLMAPFSTSRQTAAGATYDSGDYAMTLDRALELSGHADWVAERDRRRSDPSGRQLGIGVACYVEVTVGKTPPSDFGSVDVIDDGTIVARAGGSSHGQGHATAFAMIVADRFRVPMDRIRVIQSDTDLVARGGGTYASRTIQLAGSSLHEASETVIARCRTLAAELLEASPSDMVIIPGEGMAVAGSPETVVSWARLAAEAKERGEALQAESDRPQADSTYPFGAHVAVIELDPETGWCRLIAHTGVDDCGVVINPMLVCGQQHGGIAQGVGQALFEHMRFDLDGNPLTANLASYPIPTAIDLPSFTVGTTTTPTPLNPLGAKGVGEAGTLGSTPAIHSAVMDALSPYGVAHVDMPLTPEKVWSAIHSRN
jgi:aerobic carbon-monoxide dehydrogenase large subunit